MSSATYLGIIHAIERLYEAVVTNPEVWTEQAFADWADDALGDARQLPREAMKAVRRSLRAAQKLQQFWASGRGAVSDRDDWRSRVDIALGARAWRPVLDVARLGLDDAPSAELFDQVKGLFAVVHSERWMEGIDFGTWAELSNPRIFRADVE